MVISRRNAPIAWVSLLVAVLGLANWYLKPERASAWLVAMVTMAAIWVVVTVLTRKQGQSDSDRRFVVICAVTAGLLLAASLGATAVHTLGIGDESFVERAKGVSIGLMLMIIGNGVPKVVSAFTTRRCSPADLQSDQRFAGWAFALAGLLAVLAWIFVAVPQAETISTVSCAAALLLVVARCARRLLRA